MMMTRNLSEMMSASNNGAKTFNYEEAESIIKDKINLAKWEHRNNKRLIRLLTYHLIQYILINILNQILIMIL